MSMLNIPVGYGFKIDGLLLRFSHEDVSGEKLIFLDEERNPNTITEANFMKLVARRKVVHVGTGSDEDLDEKTRWALRDIASFKPKQIDEALKRRRYVLGVLALGTEVSRKASWPAVIMKIAIELHENPPSLSTVVEWRKRYVEYGGRLSSLVSMTHLRGRKPRAISQTEADFLDEHYAKYMKPGVSINSIAEAVRDGYADPNNPAARGWNGRSRASVYRDLDKLPKRDLEEVREGSGNARQQFQLVGHLQPPKHRLQYVEFDTTGSGLLVKDDDGFLLGWAWVTLGIDSLTGAPVGHHISFEPPNSTSTLQCIRDAMMPKTYVQELYPWIKLRWDVFGPISNAVVDSGIEWRGESSETLMSSCGMAIRKQPRRKPWYKGHIERFFGNLKKTLIARLAGATNTNDDERDPKKEACITLTEFRGLFLEWMLTHVYYKTNSSRLRMPATAWAEAVKKAPIPTPDVRKIDEMCGLYDSAKLTRRGLQLEYLWYQCDQLQHMLNVHGKHTVGFRIDPENLGEITVIDDKTGGHFQARCTQYGYASTVTLHQHKTIVSTLDKRAKKELMEPELVAARNALRQRLKDLGPKLTVKQARAAARLQGGDYTFAPRPGDPRPNFKNTPAWAQGRKGAASAPAVTGSVTSFLGSNNLGVDLPTAATPVPVPQASHEILAGRPKNHPVEVPEPSAPTQHAFTGVGMDDDVPDLETVIL